MEATRQRTEQKQPVVFGCCAPEAQSVYLAGMFNDWNPEVTPMTRNEQGTWRVSLELSPGHYEYKFVLDGEWCCEPRCQGDRSCPKCVTNPYGTMNRVLKVQ
ncbi:MAG: glycogen-binding domain-containing protein [Acidobacteriota bacterium]